MADGILGRWSQRKQAVREGKPLDEPVRVVPAPSPDAAPMTVPAANASAAAQIAPASELQQTLTQTPPPPTLEDVQALTPESDFSAFTGAKVSPEVSNAAMKKLFTDPHYNVMDGLDIYIDDYSKPDPLPLSMLRQMASAKFLNLFDEEEEPPVTSAVPAVPHNAPPSATPVADAVSAPLKTEDHAHPDLRLQPNDAPGAQGPGRSAE
jgi:hypothetical protein